MRSARRIAFTSGISTFVLSEASGPVHAAQNIPYRGLAVWGLGTGSKRRELKSGDRPLRLHCRRLAALPRTAGPGPGRVKMAWEARNWGRDGVFCAHRD